jgi:2-octaprenyl-6-methoxyphenol hydroxylase
LTWPLKPHFCPRISKPGFILAGDAGHALHPLAGMGFNLALADVAILLDCLQNAACSGLTPSHASVAAAYQSRRKLEILALTFATQGLNRLLTRKPGPLYQMACMGMSFLGQLPAKRLLSDLAMGGRLASAPLLSGQLRSSESK